MKIQSSCSKISYLQRIDVENICFERTCVFFVNIKFLSVNKALLVKSSYVRHFQENQDFTFPPFENFLAYCIQIENYKSILGVLETHIYLR